MEGRQKERERGRQKKEKEKESDRRRERRLRRGGEERSKEIDQKSIFISNLRRKENIIVDGLLKQSSLKEIA